MDDDKIMETVIAIAKLAILQDEQYCPEAHEANGIVAYMWIVKQGLEDIAAGIEPVYRLPPLPPKE